MFAKKFTIKSQFPVGNNDKKKLRLTIASKFNLSSETVDLLIPKDKKALLNLVKIKTTKGDVSLYVANDEPLLFQIKDDIFPTVYALWKFPMIPLVGTPIPVIQRLQNGADLMVPGMLTSQPFIAGQIVGVCPIISNDGKFGAPFMVGTAQIESGTNAGSGKAVVNVHTCYDELWKIESLTEPQFKDLESQPEDQEWTMLSDEPETETAEFKQAPATGNQKVPTMRGKKFHSIEDLPFDVMSIPSTCDSFQHVDFGNSVSAEEMDANLRASLLNCIIKMEDEVLPVSSSVFYSSMMIPSRPLGTTLDIKKSSFKKVLSTDFSCPSF
jgi:translation initiation factor 2D